MAVDGGYGPRGGPRFRDGGAPDLAVDSNLLSEQIELVGNRKVGTKAQREAAIRTTSSTDAPAQVWDGLEWFDTTEKQTYERIDGSWQRASRQQVLTIQGSSTPPADARIVTKYQFFDTLRTNASGVLRANFNSPFPNGVINMQATTVAGSANNPVVNNGNYSLTGAEWAFKDTPNTVVAFWVSAVGW